MRKKHTAKFNFKHKVLAVVLLLITSSILGTKTLAKYKINPKNTSKRLVYKAIDNYVNLPFTLPEEDFKPLNTFKNNDFNVALTQEIFKNKA